MLLIDTEKMLSTKLQDIFSGPFISTLILCLLLIIFSLVIFFKAKKALKNPLEAPKGIFLVYTIFVQFIDNLVCEIMGEHNKKFAGYISCVAMFLFFGFMFTFTGLPSPVGSLVFPLILATFTFILVHATAIKYNHWSYFKRYIDPIPIFLPINLITMWAPILSMTLRLFGNATAGFCLMTCLYYAMASVGDLITGGLASAATAPFGPASFWAPALVTPVLHLYFDVFSGFIQTTVFIMLTMISIYQEQPEDLDQVIERAQISEQ